DAFLRLVGQESPFMSLALRFSIFSIEIQEIKT
ncbi:unnamed protein product, partial [marine sediment metagenome]